MLCTSINRRPIIEGQPIGYFRHDWLVRLDDGADRSALIKKLIAIHYITHPNPTSRSWYRCINFYALATAGRSTDDRNIGGTAQELFLKALWVDFFGHTEIMLL